MEKVEKKETTSTYEMSGGKNLDDWKEEMIEIVNDMETIPDVFRYSNSFNPSVIVSKEEELA